jgi:hypothetical protein
MLPCSINFGENPKKLKKTPIFSIITFFQIAPRAMILASMESFRHMVKPQKMKIYIEFF